MDIRCPCENILKNIWQAENRSDNGRIAILVDRARPRAQQCSIGKTREATKE
jgi:hypothetical protein